MAESLAEKVLCKIGPVSELYHRLMIVAAPTGAGKTRTLQEVHQRTSAPLINVNLELSRRMLDLTERQRSLQLPRLLGEMIDEIKEDMILLDNIEILFDVALKQDPLRLLQGLSRNHTIVVSWNGSIENDFLTYAVPGHPEYRRYPTRGGGLLIVAPV
ncbi:MAG: BREX-3 system P-loop-containing protein BrxF [Proteobacteria bacterium]|nr:BREX-3 system P-loop-containing protein BrxF [Pseudomonadota bacterium]MBU2228751.1 BREX-3 system P-loop-containing protein BrxF [Pseudomonadota bacterium]MBU2262728.1 BREX-3 system P-loop-containing protein BrxF [Pseudomonadota bacterium]